MISVQEAKQSLQENIFTTHSMRVSLNDALGLVVSEEVKAVVSVPPFDNSAMDGYAIKYDEARTSYTVSHIIQAGESQHVTIETGHAARIFTGAPIPDGCDTVVQQELCRVANGTLFTGDHRVEKGQNVRMQGSQNAEHDILIVPGKVVTANIVGLLSSAGVNEVTVYQPPTVGLLVTGDELQPVGSPLPYGHIYNSNQPTLCALLRSIGIVPVESTHVPDNPTRLFDEVTRLLSLVNVLIVSGGISVGDYDYVQDTLKAAGVETLFYKVRQKPGKPLFVGKSDNAIVFGLPGNPASVITAYYQYVKPSLLAMMGRKQTFAPDAVLRLKNEVHSKRGLTQFLKAKRSDNTVTVLGRQESFDLRAFTEADCLVVIDEETEYLPSDAFVKTYFM